MPKKLFIKSYGCQMNVYDSEKMTALLKPHGYTLCETAAEADLVILNTCHIREKATEKVFSDLGRLRPFKQAKNNNNQEMYIAVAGCVAQAEGEEIIRRAPYVDMVFGPQTYYELPEALEKIRRHNQKKGTQKEHFKSLYIINTDFPIESKFDHLPATTENPSVSAFLSVQEGCDKFCSFCCVPYTRGSEFSRSVQEVTKEARNLIAAGVKEITLLGQNVTAYHGMGPNKKEWSLGRLILDLAELDGLERIRYTTSHPRDMDEDIILAHAECDKLMPYLHLPVQSGSDKILKAMNRKHTVSHYLELIEKFRKARPNICFSSDFIVGYPGETDLDHAHTLKLVNSVGYAQAYSFKYSPRPGTPASILENQISEEKKDERLQQLQQLLTAQQMAFNNKCIGQKMDILIEKPGKHPGQFIGRSPYLQSVHCIPLNGYKSIGTFQAVEITEARPHSLKGVCVEKSYQKAL